MSNQQGGKPPGGPPDPATPQSNTAPGGHGGPRALPQPFPHQQPPQAPNQAMWPPPQSPYARPQNPQPAPPAQPYPPPAAQPYPPPAQPYPPPAAQPQYPPPASPPPAAQPYPPAAQPYPPPAQPFAPGQPPPAFAPAQPPPGFAPAQPPPGFAVAQGAALAPPPSSPPPAAPAFAPPPQQWSQAPDQTVGFQQAVGRAMRLRIEPHEVTAGERAALNAAGVTDPYLQAFLAWRRSVLTLVAVLLIPLTIVRLADASDGRFPEQLKFIQVIPACLEGVLCAMCWYQLRNWTKWRTQRRTLLITWMVFMAGPFVVYLVPIDPILEGWAKDAAARGAAQAVIEAEKTGVKTILGIYALITLAPKAVSLLAGVIRCGVVTKMLFPGAAGPGWLMVLAAPIYTLFVFTLLIVPFQITGSGWLVGAMAALAVAQFTLAKAGYALARPVTRQTAVDTIQKARSVYLVAMLSFGGCLITALGVLAKSFALKTIVLTVLSFEANVLILTLIGSDLVITNLDRGRGVSEGTTNLADETNQKLATFAGVKSPFANKS